MTAAGWAVEVARDDLTSTSLLEVEVPEPADGEAVLRVDRVGVTHQDGSRAGTLAGDRPTAFFAPDRMTTRTADWGREGLDQRFVDAWRRFAPVAEQLVDVRVSTGPEALRDVWLEVLSGRSDPRTGHVLQL